MHNETRTDFANLEIAPTLSAIERLQHDRGYRDSRGPLFIEGVRNFIAAADHCLSVRDVALQRETSHPSPRQKTRPKKKRAGVPFARVMPEEFRRVSRTERASGVATILRQRVQTLDQVNLTENPYWTALSHVSFAREPRYAYANVCSHECSRISSSWGAA